MIYLVSQKMPMAKSGSQSISPDLRLIVSPNISFAFQCIWCFPCVIPHHGTNAVQTQSPNSYLWLAGHFSHLVWEGLKESSYLNLFASALVLQGRNEMFGGIGLYS